MESSTDLPENEDIFTVLPNTKTECVDAKIAKPNVENGAQLSQTKMIVKFLNCKENRRPWSYIFAFEAVMVFMIFNYRSFLQKTQIDYSKTVCMKSAFSSEPEHVKMLDEQPKVPDAPEETAKIQNWFV